MGIIVRGGHKLLEVIIWFPLWIEGEPIGDSFLVGTVHGLEYHSAAEIPVPICGHDGIHDNLSNASAKVRVVSV